MQGNINSVKQRCIFIGGKQIGVNCLKQLLRHDVIPLLIIPNLDHNGTGSWHDSLVKFAKQTKLNAIYEEKLKDPDIIKKK